MTVFVSAHDRFECQSQHILVDVPMSQSPDSMFAIECWNDNSANSCSVRMVVVWTSPLKQRCDFSIKLLATEIGNTYYPRCIIFD